MTVPVPRWASQNQSQAAKAGRDATNVGGHQITTYNTFQAARANGLNISYEDFKAAVDYERSDERSLLEARMASRENEHRGQIEEAYADYTAVVADNDALREHINESSSWWFKVRSSLPFLVGAVITFTTLGVVVGVQASGSPATIVVTPPTADATTTATSGTQVAPSVISPTQSRLSPSYQGVSCGYGQWVVQLEAINNNDGLRDTRAFILEGEIRSRLKNVKLAETVGASRGTEYCKSSSSKLADYSFLWIGPFSKEDAGKVSRQLHAKAVSEDAYAHELK